MKSHRLLEEIEQKLAELETIKASAKKLASFNCRVDIIYVIDDLGAITLHPSFAKALAELRDLFN